MESQTSDPILEVPETTQEIETTQTTQEIETTQLRSKIYNCAVFIITPRLRKNVCALS